jgi:hypothetical protein
MLVLVRYNDDNFDIVEEYCLEYLIFAGKVVEFSRSEEWVTVCEKPTREKPADPGAVPSYNGSERRKNNHLNLIHTPIVTPTT